MRALVSVIKLEIRLHEIPKAIQAFKESRKKSLDLFTEEIRSAVSNGFDQLLNSEVDLFLGDPGQSDNTRFTSHVFQVRKSMLGCTSNNELNRNHKPSI